MRIVPPFRSLAVRLESQRYSAANNSPFDVRQKLFLRFQSSAYNFRIVIVTIAVSPAMRLYEIQ